MATYFQWSDLVQPVRPASSRGAWSARGRRYRITYVCGNEPRLREIVVQASAAHADMNERQVFVADGSNDGEIWDALNTYPVLAERSNPALALGEKPTREKPRSVPVFRHVTVRDAHLMKAWDSLPGWLEDMRQVTATFDSPEPDFHEEMWKENQRACSRKHPCEEEGDILDRPHHGKNHKYCARCVQVRSRIAKHSAGILVFAHTPTTDLQKDAARRMLGEYALAPTTITPLNQLLLRTENRLGLALDALDKLNAIARVSVAKGTLTVDSVKVADEGAEATAFERALWRLNARAAVTAAADVDETEVARMFDRLDAWIGTVVRGRDMAKAGRSQGRIQRELNVDWYSAGRMAAHAGLYTDEEIVNATEALALADQAWAEGHRIGVLEVLARRWCPS